ncbi:MAG: BlaI/MecI/CopY family transcriptional regulator [Myxococcales bacterium FL481]|nr:MAG: BlaI/MecI/CopY family transcriptional regulator [Myxococcales bacterium FL481]
MTRQNLTENQLELLQVLWERGDASVQEVHEALSGGRDVAPATVATVLNRLCKDGVLERVRSGRQFRYRALLERDEVTRSMLGRVVERLFGGDGSALLSHLVKERAVSAADLDEARALLRTSDTSSDSALPVTPKSKGRRP